MSKPTTLNRAFVNRHPLVSIFLAFESVLLLGGVFIGRYAATAPSGSTTSFAHVAGILGATFVVFAILAVLTGVIYVLVFKMN